MKIKFLIFSLITICLLGVTIYLDINKSEYYIIKRGYKLFGDNSCPKSSNEIYYKNDVPFFYEDSEHPVTVGQAVTDYKCELCNKKYVHPNTGIPKICSTCSTITNRCMSCGKLQIDND